MTVSRQENKSDCPFCYQNVVHRVVLELETVSAIKDRFPVSEGHHLIIPKRHVVDYLDLTDQERKEADQLIKKIHQHILEKDPKVTGYNIGINTGRSAGQTIFHVHIHYIPRRDGDTKNPRGGVRGVIPDKMHYPTDED